MAIIFPSSDADDMVLASMLFTVYPIICWGIAVYCDLCLFISSTCSVCNEVSCIDEADGIHYIFIMMYTMYNVCIYNITYMIMHIYIQF